MNFVIWLVSFVCSANLCKWSLPVAEKLSKTTNHYYLISSQGSQSNHKAALECGFKDDVGGNGMNTLF